MSRLTWIDSLKGLAILFVVAIHCGTEGLPHNIARVVNAGGSWVQMFLTLSAVTSCLSFERQVARGSVTIKEWGWWLLRRFIRLMPLYYLAIAIACMMTGGMKYWLGLERSVSWLNVVSHLFFVHSLFPHYADSILGVEWYVGTLAIFYLLTLWLFRICSDVPRALAAFAVTVCLVHFLNDQAFCHVLPSVQDQVIVRAYFSGFWFFASLPSLIWGILVCRIMQMEVGLDWRTRKVLSVTLLIFFAIFFHGQIQNEIHVGCLSLQALLAIGFSFLTLSMHYWRLPMLDNAFLRFLGRHCYGIYLFHVIFLVNVFDRWQIPGGWHARYAGCLLFTIITTLVAEKVIDEPCRRLMTWGLDRVRAT